MKILHQTGHNPNWNLEAYFDHNIGDGFIFCAYNIEKEKLLTKISKYDNSTYIPISSVDLQFYGNKESAGLGKFRTYPFHPANYIGDDATQISAPEMVKNAIKFQYNNGFRRIIIPIIYYDIPNVSKSLSLIKSINKNLVNNKEEDAKFFMTLPINMELLKDEAKLENLLLELTDSDIIFDGFYLVYDFQPGYKKKVGDDYSYLAGIHRVIRTLKGHGFELILGYANWDSIIFAALEDIDYITIGTFENLRHFNIKRYTETTQGGPSDGWYFSEKLLNVIKAKELTNIRLNNGIDLIRNDQNIFSDVILDEDYVWSATRPDIHKNYLLAVSRLLNNISAITDRKTRIQFVVDKIEEARENYALLNSKGIILLDESSDYHLSTWLSFLKPKI